MQQITGLVNVDSSVTQILFAYTAPVHSQQMQQVLLQHLWRGAACILRSLFDASYQRSPCAPLYAVHILFVTIII